MISGNNGSRQNFVTDGRPILVMGAAIKDMRREGDALVISPDETWGNSLFADSALAAQDFHIHARLTLDRLDGTGASLLIGGFYHYSCSRPEGNQTFRVSLDDGIATYDPYTLETDARIVYGMTERWAPWSEAKREIAGRTADYIEPGKPFTIDLYQNGRDASLQINGREIFRINLREEGRLFGSDDGGWPVCFGFLPDRGVIRLHDFYAEGVFSQSTLDHKDVWMMGQDGYFTYRIPSLCVTASGSVLAFAEARRSDFGRAWGWSKNWNADAVHCVMKRSTDGGETWGEQKSILTRGTSFETRDPAPVVDRETGDIFLITRGPYILKSQDDGESWSEPRSLRELCCKNMNYLTPGPLRARSIPATPHILPWPFFPMAILECSTRRMHIAV